MKKHVAFLIILATAALVSPAARATSNSYPLKTCIVTNDDLGDDPVDVSYKGRNFRLCCKSCVKEFNANPEKYVAIFNQQMAKRKG